MWLRKAKCSHIHNSDVSCKITVARDSSFLVRIIIREFSVQENPKKLLEEILPTKQEKKNLRKIFCLVNSNEFTGKNSQRLVEIYINI